MFDHVAITVGDFERSKAFYVRALVQTGHSRLVEPPEPPGGGPRTAGFCHADGSDLWISEGDATGPPIHLAFRVSSRAPHAVVVGHAASIASMRPSTAMSMSRPGPRLPK